MAGWDGWSQHLKADKHGHECANVYGIYGPRDSNFQTYSAVPAGFNPGKEFFDKMEAILKTGPGGDNGKVTVAVPGEEVRNFMILRCDDQQQSIIGKCKATGLTVSKSNNLFIVSIYTKEGIQAGNCTAQNGVVQDMLKSAGY